METKTIPLKLHELDWKLKGEIELLEKRRSIARDMGRNIYETRSYSDDQLRLITMNKEDYSLPCRGESQGELGFQIWASRNLSDPVYGLLKSNSQNKNYPYSSYRYEDREICFSIVALKRQFDAREMSEETYRSLEKLCNESSHEKIKEGIIKIWEQIQEKEMKGGNK